MPEVLVAGGDVLEAGGAVVDGEEEYGGGVTAEGVGEGDSVDRGGVLELRLCLMCRE